MADYTLTEIANPLDGWLDSTETGMVTASIFTILLTPDF